MALPMNWFYKNLTKIKIKDIKIVLFTLISRIAETIISME